MTRTLLATATVLGVVLAGPALAAGSASVNPDEKHVCVLLDSQNNTGYCVKTYGVHLPTLP